MYLAPLAHGRGVGRQLYDRLFRTLRDLGYLNAYAGIALPNAASVRLHESLGFAPVGVFRHVGFKFGRWHDVGWWSLELADPATASEPAEPRQWR